MNILIVNGFAGSGKDTFMKHIKSYGSKYNHRTENVSIIDYIKRIALTIGWNGEKDEAGRKLLSDLMTALTLYDNIPLKKIYEIIDGCVSGKYNTLCICARSPKDIDAIIDYATIYDIQPITIFIQNDNIEQITSNEADANVLNYLYDVTIENNSTIDDFYNKINEFYDSYLIKE